MREQGRRRIAVATAVLGGAVAAITGPIGPVLASADAATEAAYAEAEAVVVEELASLQQLGWLTEPVPPAARTIAATASLPVRPREDVARTLADLDDRRGPAALDRLRELGVAVPDEVALVLADRLPPLDGPPPRVGAGPYVRAHDQLQALRAGGPTRRADDRPVTPVGTTTTAAPVASASATPLTTVGIVAVLLVVAALLLAWWRRTVARRAVVAAELARDDVLQTGRLVMAAPDRDSLARLVAARSRALAGASSATVVIDGREWSDGAPGPVARDVVADVLATGRPRAVRGVVVVPLIARGRVLGALHVRGGRVGDAPLDELASLVGVALDSLDRRSESDQLAFVDALTMVANRRRFDADLRAVADGAGAPGRVAVAMIDVDHFKVVNDTFGHQGGDRVLAQVAAVIAANVREGDLVYRYGGEEFAVLLPDTGLDDAVGVIERVRHAVAAALIAPVDDGSTARVTVSAGVCARDLATAASPSGAALVRAADAALYEAKALGRDRTVAASAPAGDPADGQPSGAAGSSTQSSTGVGTGSVSVAAASASASASTASAAA